MTFRAIDRPSFVLSLANIIFTWYRFLATFCGILIATSGSTAHKMSLVSVCWRSLTIDQILLVPRDKRQQANSHPSAIDRAQVAPTRKPAPHSSAVSIRRCTCPAANRAIGTVGETNCSAHDACTGHTDRGAGQREALDHIIHGFAVTRNVSEGVVRVRPR